MLTSELEGTPIRRIIERDTWATWDREAENDDLLELVGGKRYWFLSDSLTYVGGYLVDKGWTAPASPLYWIEFKSGDFITINNWRHAVQALNRVGLFTFLEKTNIREVRVLDTLPGYGLGDVATFHQVDRAIEVLDTPPFPASVFPAILLHEAFHMWVQDNPNPITGEGQPIDTVRRELPAYVFNFIFHILSSDGVKVFRPPVGETAVYPLAAWMM